MSQEPLPQWSNEDLTDWEIVSTQSEQSSHNKSLSICSKNEEIDQIAKCAKVTEKEKNTNEVVYDIQEENQLQPVKYPREDIGVNGNNFDANTHSVNWTPFQSMIAENEKQLLHANEEKKNTIGRNLSRKGI